MYATWNLYMKALISFAFLLISSFRLLADTCTLENKYSITGKTEDKTISYTICYPLDLNGDSLILPEKSRLIFLERGCISNGTILGNQTSLNASAELIFKDINIAGSWNNDKVFGKWINFPPEGNPCDKAFQNLMALCTGNKLTHFYLNEGTYCVSAYYKSAPIIVPSNVYWHNKAEIRMLPTDLSWYNTVLLNKVENVTIDGGSFIGDVVSHQGKEGEWGHGIKCGGATNICLKNITCSFHWGDGIDLIEGLDDKGAITINCYDIRIDSVKCLHNRRQGMSIEAAHNVTITKSEFAYTGAPDYTAPGAGLDIEPWCNNRIKIRNISISECNFHDNKGPDLFILSNLFQEKYKEINNLIRISKSNIGSCQFKFSSGIKIYDCIFNKTLTIKNSSHIVIKKSYIFDYYSEDIENIDFKDCKFKKHIKLF